METETIKIIKAKKSDMKEFSIIYKKVFSEGPYNEKWTNKNLIDKVLEIFKKQKVYVAKINNKIVGFISFYNFIGSEGKIGCIFEFGVDKKYRNKKIGKILIKKAEEESRKAGCKSMVLDVNKKASAVGFYKNLGYVDLELIKVGKSLK